jgi:hypothetical protein
MGNSSDLNPPPCGCENPKPCTCHPPRPCTKCDRHRKNNIWVERADQPGNKAPGICLLDTMTKSQVIYVLEHDPKAARDLIRVTSDPELLYLARNITLLPTALLVDMEQTVLNRSYQPESYPFYGVFAGRPPHPYPRSGNVDDDSGQPGTAPPPPFVDPNVEDNEDLQPDADGDEDGEPC